MTPTLTDRRIRVAALRTLELAARTATLNTSDAARLHMLRAQLDMYLAADGRWLPLPA